MIVTCAKSKAVEVKNTPVLVDKSKGYSIYSQTYSSRILHLAQQVRTPPLPFPGWRSRRHRGKNVEG